MKIDRLMGIITVLLQKEKVTVSYLAERFEVSKRTINRDIDDIAKAGIPVLTMQGASGGIMIAEGYKIEKTLFKKEELLAILTGLQGLDSVAMDKKYQNIMDKFFTDKQGVYRESHLMIDLSSHYKNSLAPKINTILQAIETGTTIEFVYYSGAGERLVTLEPYVIVFQWSSWYLLGRDPGKNGFRLFKLNRLWKLQDTSHTFEPMALPDEKLDFNQYFTDEIKAVVLFDQSVKYRLVEEYGPDCYTTLENGKLRFQFPFTNRDYLLEWVLQFGEKAELLQPEGCRAKIKNRLENAIKHYYE